MNDKEGREYVRKVWPNAQTEYDHQLESGVSVDEAISVALDGISYDPSEVK